MSAKRAASEELSEPEEGEIKDRPIKVSRKDGPPPDANGGEWHRLVGG